MPIITAGLEEAALENEADKASRPRRFSVDILPIKAGDKFFFRPITEINGVVSGHIHPFMPTKEEPEGYPGTWRKQVWTSICQNSKMYRLRDPKDPRHPLDEFEPGYGNCYLCSTYKGRKVSAGAFDKDQGQTSYMTFGLFVVRKPRINQTTGKIVGFDDEMVEHRVTVGEGKAAKVQTYQIPRIVVLAQRFDTLWHPLYASSEVEGTICNQDWAVGRAKDNNKADGWSVASLTHTNGRYDEAQQKWFGHDPSTPSWKVYQETLELLGFNLTDWFLSHGTPDHYKRWFLPGEVPEGGYGRKDGEEEEAEDAGTAVKPAATAGESEIDEAAMAAFASSMDGRGGS